MRTVLIVDDDRSLLQGLKEGLTVYANYLQVMFAEQGAQACVNLSSTPVDLVVTDLAMPVLDGFELLAHMSIHYPHIPTIVMSDIDHTRDIEKELTPFAVAHTIRKPFDVRDMTSLIFNELQAVSAGHLHNFGLAAFVQLIETERRTCTLTITFEEEKGFLYFKKGDLMDARTGMLTGIDAASHMIGWGQSEIIISPRCQKSEKAIWSSVNTLFMKEEGSYTNGVNVHASEGPSDRSVDC